MVKSAPMLEIVGDWRKFLAEPEAEDTRYVFRRHERTGRPLGDDRFVTKPEGMLNRALKPKKPRRKPTRRKN